MLALQITDIVTPFVEQFSWCDIPVYKKLEINFHKMPIFFFLEYSNVWEITEYKLLFE